MALVGCGPDSHNIQAVPHQDQYLHVADDGYSGNAGTAEAPLSYPANAIEKALAEGYRGVKIAAGDYLLSLNGVRTHLYGGLDIIGGCDRTTWEPIAGRYSKVYAMGDPIEGLSIRVPTLVRGMDFRGTRARENRPSSLAVYLEGCTADLRFEQCRFVARPGLDAPAPWNETSLPQTAQPPQAGGESVCDSAAVVPGGHQGQDGSSGGWGGAGGQPDSPGQSGWHGRFFDSGTIPEGGAGGEPGQDGQPGADGLSGQNSPGGTATPGLGEVRYHTIFPDEGQDSQTGQWGEGGGGGGGGGGSATTTGNGGGGGGTGGWGGNSAAGGQSGGHSIGLLSVNNTAVFRDCAFVTDTGGHGGAGADGVAGAQGTAGAPGGSNCLPDVGRGGDGGTGGDGGASGGGAGGNGGSCIGLLELGTERVDVGPNCIFVNGQPGTPGLGGKHGYDQTPADTGNPGQDIGHLILLPINSINAEVSNLEVKLPASENDNHPAIYGLPVASRHRP